MKRIKLLEVRSELGAGTRGASMGIDALRVACLNKGSDYFRRFNSVVVPDLNHVLFDKNHFVYAKHIDSIYTVQKAIAGAVEQTLRFGEFPLVLAGDHSNANATIAGIKATYPQKTLGVVWIDAHADIHSPYTTPSGNVHGMPMAAALNEDNLDCQRNRPDPETEFFWRRLQNLGEPGPKLKPEHLVYVVVRDTEEQEDALIEQLGIKNFTLDESPTLEVVAARAGVSRATASRVLTGSPRVSPGAQGRCGAQPRSCTTCPTGRRARSSRGVRTPWPSWSPSRGSSSSATPTSASCCAVRRPRCPRGDGSWS